MSVCVSILFIMSCVHRRTFHQYKLCIVVQYICMWIYIYKPICPWVCPVYIDVVFVDGRGSFRCPEIWNFLLLLSFFLFSKQIDIGCNKKVSPHETTFRKCKGKNLVEPQSQEKRSPVKLSYFCVFYGSKFKHVKLALFMDANIYLYSSLLSNLNIDECDD